MTNLIIASFAQEAQAITAFHKLTELESIGDLTIYESVIVQKNAQGETGVVQTGNSTEGVRTLSGMALGTLVGAFAGPVGILAGMLLGTMGGAVWEANYFNFTEEFSRKVADSLKPGYTALIAEVDEDNEVFADTYIKSLGGTLLRTDVDFEYEKIVDDQVEALDEQIAADRAKLRTAEAADKARFEKEIAELKEKRKQRIAELKSAVKKSGAHTEATLKEMRATRLKSRIELYKRRIATLESELGKL
ncbi:DUF1269 domain-containing protein [Chitinophaga sp. sic0106]|uniref:DUF1269 domain-containing protein n=1 Tax=Chitinophaga sp. sic0106 TaxID=2854785 RepID=UPI001C486C5E|nr:DUF1269 domain-containing protein [Chitinophaga sp. sic0106]MBV7533137.1 DUF1269 domain-containing protein [Chitinophaga sp. sic0106]